MISFPVADDQWVDSVSYNVSLSDLRETTEQLGACILTLDASTSSESYGSLIL